MMGVRTGRTMSRYGKLPCDVMNDVEGAKKGAEGLDLARPAEQWSHS